MKVSQFMLFGIFFIGISSAAAQEKKSLPLNAAINLAWTNSNEVTRANAKVTTKKYELQSKKTINIPI